MSCLGNDKVLAVGWNLGSSTPPSAILYSFTTKAAIPEPTSLPKFGLTSKVNIVSAGLVLQTKGTAGLYFNIATYLPNTKILTADSMLFNLAKTGFEDSGLVDYIFTDTWYTSNHRVCFLTQSFVVYDSSFADKTVRGFFGEFYGNLKKYYARNIYDLTQAVSDFSIKQFFCHRLTDHDSFSVYGEKTFVNTTDSKTYTNSILATYTVSDLPDPQRLYNVEIMPKKFNAVRVSDDGRRAIYFTLKEFMSSNIFYRVQYADDQTLA